MEGNLVRFQSSDGLETIGFLAEPQKSKKAVIYVHGMRDNLWGPAYHSFRNKGKPMSKAIVN